ncbi:MAG: TonB-dependent receptor [Sphingobacteriales bacterium]|nr:MAG: TonB-dependent receptor [Sphingobacteriales bacterium]TAF78422.1 MAG: TonB-dependent receptor [Sphingobacteriales bacterium]
MRLNITIVLLWVFVTNIKAQNAVIKGTIKSSANTMHYATIHLVGTNYGTSTDSTGFYKITQLPQGKYTLKVSKLGYFTQTKELTINTEKDTITLNFNLQQKIDYLNEVVVTGTMKEVKRLESAVPVEVYSPQFLKKNPTSCIFDALQNVNGVRPQLNCNICNTGDIHINGLEGPYTMVLIDGMPIVSSLATVYGLSGIPNSLVDRIEIVKGPASSLYGSEAVGGLINIITKTPTKVPKLAVDVMTTSWLETNADIGFKLNTGKKASVLTGINFFNYKNIIDNNHDNFTDVTLQKRVSVFQKWNFERKNNKVFNFATRFYNEDRWGGDVRWTKQFRGGDSIYGESIYTKRWEIMGQYQLPLKEKILFAFSYNQHQQDSRYGTTIYDATQRIAFSQLTWDKTIYNHDLLLGTAFRHTFYDDNTPATASASKIFLPGMFIQDEISLNQKHKLLLGFRYDYNSAHKSIYTPRVAYKWSITQQDIVRLNAGTGFRVVNLFTEDHASLTGAREVEIKNELKPEKTYNINLNYLKKIYLKNSSYFGIDFSTWYTYFNNRIIADYDTNPNKIIYNNLNGFAESKGITANIDYTFTNGLKVILGATYMDVTTTNNGIKAQQILTENYTGTWAVSYKIEKLNLAIDYTGNVYSPMRLPLLSDLDPRQPKSPWWSIQNIQLLYSKLKNIEIYGGIKNLLNFLPTKGNPFIIARTNDPFDKQVQYNTNGQVLATPTNPYALTFDPSYIYAPNQGIRGFLGLRFNLK